MLTTASRILKGSWSACAARLRCRPPPPALVPPLLPVAFVVALYAASMVERAACARLDRASPTAATVAGSSAAGVAATGLSSASTDVCDCGLISSGCAVTIAATLATACNRSTLSPAAERADEHTEMICVRAAVRSSVEVALGGGAEG